MLPRNTENKAAITTENFKNQALIDYFIAPIHVHSVEFKDLPKLNLENISLNEEESLVMLVACAIICGDVTTVQYFKETMDAYKAKIGECLKQLYTETEPMLTKNEPMLGRYMVRFKFRQLNLDHKQADDLKMAELFDLEIGARPYPYETAGSSCGGPAAGDYSGGSNELTSLPNDEFSNVMQSSTNAEDFAKSMDELKFSSEHYHAKWWLDIALERGDLFKIDYFLAKGVPLKLYSGTISNILRFAENKETVLDRCLTHMRKESKEDFQSEITEVIKIALQYGSTSVIKMIIDNHLKDEKDCSSIILHLIKGIETKKQAISLANLIRDLKQNKNMQLFNMNEKGKNPIAWVLLKRHRIQITTEYSRQHKLARIKEYTSGQRELLKFFMSEVGESKLLNAPFEEDNCLLNFAVRHDCPIEIINDLIKLYDTYQTNLPNEVLDTALQQDWRNNDNYDAICHRLMVERKLSYSMDSNKMLQLLFCWKQYGGLQFSQPTLKKAQMIQHMFQHCETSLFESKQDQLKKMSSSLETSEAKLDRFPFPFKDHSLETIPNTLQLMGHHLQEDTVKCIILQYHFYCEEISSFVLSKIGVRGLSQLIMDYSNDSLYAASDTAHRLFGKPALERLPFDLTQPQPRTHHLRYQKNDDRGYSVEVVLRTHSKGS